MAGQAPTLLPLLQVIGNAYSLFAQGINPTQGPAHTPMVPEYEFKAGASYPRVLHFVNSSWNNLGGTVVFPDLPQRVLPYTSVTAKRTLGRDARADAMDWLEKILGIPTPMGVLRPIQRFIRISDQGTSDRLRSIAREVRQDKSQAAMQVTTGIVEFILEHKAQLPLDIPKVVSQRLYADMASKGYVVGKYTAFHQKVRELGLVRHANPYLNAYMSSQSQEEKALILLDMLDHAKPREEAPLATGTGGR